MQEIPSTDRYTDWQLLGKGGMAEVYLVYDRLLKRQVCIKLILPKHTARADLVRRFMREAQAMARLDNPHVLKIFDVGELGDGRPYFTMEYISGGSLQQLIRSFQSRGEPFPVNDALQILGQVARGLQAIHQAEMVHRDLKPANILLRRQSSGETGQPLHAVIADLGIVALEDASRVLTAPGSVIGTVSYMSPEQVSGRMVNAQTDIYACGVILYQLLTDRLPFTGDEMEVMRQHQLVAPPDLQKYRPGLPDLIYRLVAACLQKSPELRLRHSGALLVAIEQARAALAAGGPAALPP